jgi:hypothetical protein
MLLHVHLDGSRRSQMAAIQLPGIVKFLATT